MGEVAEWLKAAVSKTVMGHWPIESSNLSLSASPDDQPVSRQGALLPPREGVRAGRDRPPAAAAMERGGLKQMKVKGRLNGVEYASNTMPAGGRVLALSLSKKMLAGAGLKVGDEADVEIERLA